MPGFYLKRFANGSTELSVRDRTTGALSTRSYLTMKITDFYTVVGQDGALDVIVNVGADYPQHQPDCFITKGELARRRRAGLKSGKTWSQIVHIYYTRPSGVADALEIALPLTPKSILFLGPIGGYSEPQARLRGAEAEHLASKVNEHVITQSLSWVAANPAHPHFTSMDFPPPAPLIAVCDGGSVMSEQLRNAPEPRRPRLLRDWK